MHVTFNFWYVMFLLLKLLKYLSDYYVNLSNFGMNNLVHVI